MGMSLIEKLGLEKCKQIVDGAPKTATHYNMNILGGHYAREGVLKMKTQWEWFNTINKEWYFDFAEHNHIALLDLRTALADHDRIDACSDIKNHISPNTKVIER